MNLLLLKQPFHCEREPMNMSIITDEVLHGERKAHVPLLAPRFHRHRHNIRTGILGPLYRWVARIRTLGDTPCLVTAIRGVRVFHLPEGRMVCGAACFRDRF